MAAACPTINSDILNANKRRKKALGNRSLIT